VNPSGDRISGESLIVPAGGKHLMYRVGQWWVATAGFPGVFRYPTSKAFTAEIAEYAEKPKMFRIGLALAGFLGELGVLGGEFFLEVWC
jgi:hypothetical protein